MGIVANPIAALTTPPSFPSAPPPEAPKDQPNQTETIESLASRIKDRYPQYANEDDHDLVSRYIQKHPVYQTYLKGTELQRLANPNPAPENYGFTAGNLASNAVEGVKQLAKGVAGAAVDAANPSVPLVEGPNSLLSKYLTTPAAEEQKKASDLWGRPGAANKVEAAGHQLASYVPILGPWAANLGEQAGSGDVGGALAKGAAQYWAGKLAEAAKVNAASAVNPARDATAEAIARPTLARPLSKVRADRIYGHDPETAIVKEKVSTPAEATAKMDEVGQALQDRLNTHTTKTIDNAAIINRVAQQFINDAVKHGKDNVAAAVEKARDAYLDPNKWGNLNRSPHATANFKSELYKEIKWRGGDDAATTADNYRRALASELRDKINATVQDPEVAQLNQRYGDLASARDALQRQEDAMRDKGILERGKDTAAKISARKAAQLIGRQYPDLPTRSAGNAPAAPANAPATAGAPQAPPAGNLPGGNAPGLNPPFWKPGNIPLNAQGNASALPPAPPAGITQGGGGGIPQAPTPAVLPPRPTPTGRAAPPSTGEIRDMPGTDVSGQPVGRPLLNKAPITAGPAPAEAIRNMEAELSGLKTRIVREGAPPELLRQAAALQDKLDATRAANPEAPAPQAPAQPAKGKKAEPEPRASKTPTFDSMPREIQQYAEEYANALREMPQALQREEMEDLRKYGGPGTPLKERIALREKAHPLEPPTPENERE